MSRRTHLLANLARRCTVASCRCGGKTEERISCCGFSSALPQEDDFRFYKNVVRARPRNRIMKTTSLLKSLCQPGGPTRAAGCGYLPCFSSARLVSFLCTVSIQERHPILSPQVVGGGSSSFSPKTVGTGRQVGASEHLCRRATSPVCGFQSNTVRQQADWRSTGSEVVGNER